MLFNLFLTLLLLLILLLLLYLVFKQRTLQLQLDARDLIHAKSVERASRGLFSQLESLLFLRDRLGLDQGMPYTRDWSAAPDFLKCIAEHTLAQPPRRIVECSSGLTTLVLARCCELNGAGEVISLENGAEYAQRTRDELARYALDGRARVLDAPLEPVEVDGERFDWYRLQELPAGSIDMLVIDGPPGFIQRQSRFPALPLLHDKLADECTLFLDDAARPDERALVARWLALYPDFEHDYLDLERGCSILRRRRRT